MPARARNFAGDIAAFRNNTEALDSGCIVWTGGHGSNGYGVTQVNGRPKSVHRFALELSLGHDLTEGECALHACDRRDCVRVGDGHLFVGTKADNTTDMINKGRQFNGDSRRKVTIGEVVKMEKLRTEGQSWYAIGAAFHRAQQHVKKLVEQYRDTQILDEVRGLRKDVQSARPGMPAPEQGMAVAA